MINTRIAIQQALEVLEDLADGAEEECGEESCRDCQAWRPVWATIATLKTALEQPERTLTDEKIAELWHQNGGFHHHFARAVERYLKGEK